MTDADVIEAAAAALREATESGVPCAPVRDLVGSPDDLDTAYAIQDRNTALDLAAGRRVSGRKIGLTSAAVQAQVGVDRPDFGTLFVDMEFGDGVEIPAGRLLQPRAEAEVAIVVDRDLDRAPHGFAEIVRATAFALPAIEIVDSRIRDWDIRLVDTVADNASCGLYVLGGRPVPLAAIDLRTVPMTMSVNEVGVSTGAGAACLGHPLHAARWLADTLCERGIPLRAGDVVMTGALGPMHAIVAGDVVVASFGPLGTVTTALSPVTKEKLLMSTMKAAVIGSGNIGTDLFIKSRRLSEIVEVIAMVGIDPDSDGLARAKRMGAAITADGVDGLVRLDEFADVEIVFDATSAGAHAHHNEVLSAAGKRILDLTPAAIGPYVVPSVNLDEHLDAPNLNMVTCGGQATVPMIAAVNRAAPVQYGEIVSSIASRSAGPGTRANIDEFTETTAKAVEVVGGAVRGKAIIVLNPAEPPLIMRNTVYCLVQAAEPDRIRDSVHEMVERVRGYVPGYRIKQEVQFDEIDDAHPIRIPEMDRKFTGWKVSIFLEVEGAGHYLPPYAGNLDIMTSAAIKTAEELARRKVEK